MKIVALLGSYRKKGNTARVVEQIENELREQAQAAGETLEVETVFLGELAIDFCRGCRVCFDRGEDRCPVKDDLLPLKAKLLEADAIIAASPVYVDDVSGVMKTWIDRMAHLCHRPGLPGKVVYLVATTGTSPTGRTLDTLSTAFSTWGCTIVGQTGFVTGALMPAQEMQTRFTARSRAAAKRIFKAARQPHKVVPSFRALITFRVQQIAWQRHADDDSVDARYWRESGWIDPHSNFYAPHSASRAKLFTAGLAANLIALFILR